MQITIEAKSLFRHCSHEHYLVIETDIVKDEPAYKKFINQFQAGCYLTQKYPRLLPLHRKDKGITYLRICSSGTEYIEHADDIIAELCKMV